MYKETLYRGKNLFIIRDKVLYRGVLIDFEEQDYGYKTIDLHIKINEELKIFGIESPKMETSKVKARVCPQCGKVELYIIKGEK